MPELGCQGQEKRKLIGSHLNLREYQLARLALWPCRDYLIVQLHRAIHVRRHRGRESRVDLLKKNPHFHQRKTVPH